MKRNITLAIDGQLLMRARSFAARRGTSVSTMLAGELQKMVERDTDYEQSKKKALAQLRSALLLGSPKMRSREALHDRQNLR